MTVHFEILIYTSHKILPHVYYYGIAFGFILPIFMSYKMKIMNELYRKNSLGLKLVI